MFLVRNDGLLLINSNFQLFDKFGSRLGCSSEYHWKKNNLLFFQNSVFFSNWILTEWYLTGRFEATEIMFSFKNSLTSCTNLSLQSLSFQDFKGTSKYRNSVKAWMRYFKEILVWNKKHNKYRNTQWTIKNLFLCVVKTFDNKYNEPAILLNWNLCFNKDYFLFSF